MRLALALTLVAGLLASCDFGGKSEADKLHELRVACLTGGRAWNAATGSCGDRRSVAPDPTTPVPPAAERIAFSSNRDGDHVIYVMDADGGNVQQLTDDPGWDESPAWSPA